jgi:hypothetical protein
MGLEIFALIIAVVGVGRAIVGVILAMMFWVCQEANSLRFEAKEDRKDLIRISRNMELEMKDFHQKLLELERSKVQNLRTI